MNDAASPLKLFVSYSHADKAILAELDKHLASARREQLLISWHDRKISAGQVWEDEINDALDQSDIVVFLVTADFINSDYCMGKEVARALERHESGRAIVIPVIARPVDWLSTPLSKLQALPEDGRAISTWEHADEAWLKVAMGIRAACAELRRRRTLPLGRPLFSVVSSDLVDAVERIERLYTREDSSLVAGIATGLADLDEALDGLHKGDLVLVACAPIMDRLGFLLSIVVNACVRTNCRGLIFSMRQPKAKVVNRLITATGRLSVMAMGRGRLHADDWEQLSGALGKLNETQVGIVDSAYIDVETLFSQVEQFRAKIGGIDLVIIDGYERISADSKAQLLSKLSTYAKAAGIAFVVAGGLERDPSTRPNKRPVMGDLGEWANLNEDADVVLFLYQDEQYDPDSSERNVAEVIVERNPRGEVGTIRATYLREQQTFENFGIHDH